jgi:beta-lactamase regulating signal transducer with metallopeptidase domain
MSTFPEIFSLFQQLFHSGVFCPLFDAFRSFAHHVAPLAVAGVWQGAIIAAGLALCLRLVPRVAAAHRFAAWAAAFGILVALPLTQMHIFISHSGAAGGPGDAASLPSTPHPLFSLDDRWSLAIAALWLLLALVRAIDLAIHTDRLRQLWKSARAIRAVLPLEESGGWGQRQPRFELCTTHELDRPSVIGFFRPRVLIPEWLMKRLTPQELEQVVLHEAEHLRRCDDWTNLLQKLCLVVFPLNPALAFIERRLCGEREMACDEGVVRRTQAPRAYAACLAGLAERHMEHRAEALGLGARAKALTLSAFGRRPELTRRVHSILLRRGAINPLVSRAMMGTLGCALTIGAVALARCPQLVEFVPNLSSRNAMADATLTDKVTDRTSFAASKLNAGSFKAMNTMAIVPQTLRQRIASSRRTMASSASGPNSPTSCPRTRTSLLGTAINAARIVSDNSSHLVASNTMAGAMPERELVVFTAYEQVTSSDELGDRVVSDSAPDGGTGTQPERNPAGQFTITRLVFRVVPNEPAATNTPKPSGAPVAQGAMPGAVQQSSTQAAQKSASNSAGQALQPEANSENSMPHAVALGNGWFVIQL